MVSEKPTKGVEFLRRYLQRGGLRATASFLAMGLVLVVAIVAAGREVDQHIDAIESWIAHLGPWGVLAFVVLFVVSTSLLVPDTLLCIIAGALFGMGWGAAAILFGGLLAAALQFALSRRLLRAPIVRMLARKPSLAAIQRAVMHDELRLQVLLRLAPLNPATISYLLGASGVRFGGFLIACLAMFPNLIIGVYFGNAGKHMAQLAGGNAQVGRLQNLVFLGGMVASVVVLVLVSRTARKAVTQAVAAPYSVTIEADRTSLEDRPRNSCRR